MSGVSHHDPQASPAATPAPGSAEWTHLLESAKPQLRTLHRMECIANVAVGVTHEFNNLLLAIRGNAGLLLLNESLDPAARARVEQLEEAAGRATELTRRFQGLARGGEARPALIDLNDAVAEAVELARLVWRRKIQFTLEPAPRPLPVLLDFAEAIRTVLALCGNAAEAMPDGGTVVIVTDAAPPTPAQAPRLRQAAGVMLAHVSVRDEGAGISPGTTPRLGSPLFTTKPDGRGTGLGLANVHETAQTHGGLLDIDSGGPGTGATVSVHLPLATTMG